ncbi:BON domain-containing protein [Holosporaceae bacterium 'Namur']|nr:BON domain-containing protein [Holosporaceae bacterium 'Namur']
MIIKNLKALAIATSIVALGTANIANAKVSTSTDHSSTVKNLVPDSAITASIKSEFLADSTINGLSIHVETINGVVTLTGNVPSEDMKNRAISIAQSRDGVKKVVSKMKITTEKHPVKTAVSDSAITASIKSEFLADSAINGLSIHVETKNGVVTLTGNVPSEDMKNRAISIAQNRDGVKKVNSKLKVTGEKHPVKTAVSDSAITASIKRDFLADSAINGLSIHVETSNGVVVLTGDVPNGDMKARAESIAQSKDGVKQVVSKLRIK